MEKQNSIFDDELIIRYVLGECSPEEQAFMDDALTSNTQLYQEVERWRKLLDVIAITYMDVEKRWNNLEGRLTQTHSVGVRTFAQKISSFRYLVLAASLLILIGFTTWLFFYLSSSNRLITQYASEENLQLMLKDGSMVVLNRQSTLTYPVRFSSQERRVRLDGEAHFQVQPEENRKFIVETDYLVVTVLGTSFYVRDKSGEQPMVLVETGVVECQFKPTMEKVQLSQGQSAVFDTSITDNKQPSIHRSTAEQMYNDIAWKTRKLNFRNEPLDNIVRYIEKTYPVHIRLQGNLSDCKLTVSFDNLSLNGVINVLQAILDFKYVIKQDTIIMIGDGC